MFEKRFNEFWISIRAAAREAVRHANKEENINLRFDETLADNLTISNETPAISVEIWRSGESVTRLTRLCQSDGEIKYGRAQFRILGDEQPYLVHVADDNEKMIATEKLIEGALEVFRPAYSRS